MLRPQNPERASGINLDDNATRRGCFGFDMNNEIEAARGRRCLPFQTLHLHCSPSDCHCRRQRTFCRYQRVVRYYESKCGTSVSIVYYLSGVCRTCLHGHQVEGCIKRVDNIKCRARIAVVNFTRNRIRQCRLAASQLQSKGPDLQ
jgi:hypothetical protein